MNYLFTKDTLEDAVRFLDYCSSSNKSDKVGFDIETSGLDFSVSEMAGFSVHLPEDGGNSAYFQISHGKYVESGEWVSREDNIDIEHLWESLQELFDSKIIGLHFAEHDMLFFNRMGFKFTRIEDSASIANRIQSKVLGLKDLILTYRLADGKRILSYPQIICLVNNITEAEYNLLSDKDRNRISDFRTIDLKLHPSALDYACWDAEWTYQLYDVLLKEQIARDGEDSSQNCPCNTEIYFYGSPKLINEFVDSASVLLTESTAKGYMVDTEILYDEIAKSRGAYVGEYNILLSEIRRAMGWKDTGEIIDDLNDPDDSSEEIQ